MTDYIASVLREQEEREERRAENDWRKAWEETTLPISDAEEQTDAEGADEGAAESGRQAEETSAGETADGDTAAVGLLFEEVTAEGYARRPEAAGAVRSTAPGADWIYRELRRSLTELPAARPESRVVTLQKPGEKVRPGGWDAAGLDRLVRRDARRFDGGFQLL